MKIKNFAGALLFALCYCTAHAQQTKIDTSHTAALLEEVIVSANKVEENTKTIAQQVQTMGNKEIATLQSLSTADLLAQNGNVFVQKSQLGGGSINMRGFEANRVLLVIDGVRMNNLIYRAGHLQNIVTTDNNSLDRVELLFGPSSTIYGSDALGGVVHLYTKKPLLTAEGQKRLLKGSVFSRYGSAASESTSHLDFNIGGKRIASFTSLTYSHFGDLRGGTNQNPFYDKSYGERSFYAQRINGKDSLVKNTDRYQQVQSGYQQVDVVQKILFQQTAHTQHQLNVQYSTSTDVPRYDRLTDATAKGLKFATWNYGPQKRLLAAYDMNIKSSTFEKVHIGISYQNITESRHTRKFGNNNLMNRYERVQVWGGNLDFYKIIQQHHIRFGLDAQWNGLQSTARAENITTLQNAPLDTRYPGGANSMSSVAAYVSHTWHITPQLTLVDGFRAGFTVLNAHFNDTTFFKFPFSTVVQHNPVFSGSIGIIHLPSPDWKLSAMVSTGYRTPNIDDLSKVFESTTSAIIVPNTNLKPEKTINTELAITKIIHQKSKWENVVYYTQLYDAIVTDKFSYQSKDSINYDGMRSAVMANQNKQKAYIYGFSSNFRSQISYHFELSATASYTYGRLKTDSSDYPMDHIPPFLTRVSLGYNYKKFSANFFINYHGWKRLKNYNLNGEDNEQYATTEGMPAWLTANIRAAYQIHSKVVIQTGIDNLLDTQYRTFASGINASGRNIFATLKVSF